jgi:RNA polymerase sigma-70 factor (ECF subfamily)
MNSKNNNDLPFLSSLARLIKDAPRDDIALLNQEHSAKSDKELVQAFLSGNESCFAVLVDRHISMVYKFAYRYLNNADDASDVAQDVFIKVWKYLKRFDVDKNFKTWLLTITKNTALDFIKRKKPILFSKIEEGDGDLDAFLSPFLETADLPNEAIDRKHVRAELNTVLEKLPQTYRSVLSLRYDEHLKFREIAEVLHEPIDTVKSKHRRGLILLRKSLEGQEHNLWP